MTRWRRYLSGVGVVALLAFGCARATLGVDIGDGAHAVALAVRMSLGDKPFQDEMNAQALGSLAAVPFAWAWQHTVGMTGIVLASRIFFVALAVAVGLAGYRALRTGLEAPSALAGVVVALSATPYNLLVASYNTMPILALVLGTTSAFAAARTGSHRWAGLAGVSLCVSAASHPGTLPAVLVALCATLAVLRRRRAVVTLLASMAGCTAVGAGLVALVGFGAVQETLAFTTAYQTLRLAPGERLELWLEQYGAALGQPAVLAVLAIAALACLPLRLERIRAVLLLTVTVALGVIGVIGLLEAPDLGVGMVSASWVTVLAAVLLLPVAVSAVRRRDAAVGTLLILSVPPALVGVPAMALLTSSSPHWGAAVAPASPLVLTVVAGVVRALGRPTVPTDVNGIPVPCRRDRRSLARDRRVVALGAAVVLLTALTVQSMYSFRGGLPWHLPARVAAGPNAGLSTTERSARSEACELAAASRLIQPGGLLSYGDASVYLRTDYLPVGDSLVDGHLRSMDTNILWLGAFGSGNQHTVDWIERTGRRPATVVLDRATVRSALGWAHLVRTDPVIAWVASRYRAVGATDRHLFLHDGGQVDPTVVERWLQTGSDAPC